MARRGEGCWEDAGALMDAQEFASKPMPRTPAAALGLPAQPPHRPPVPRTYEREALRRKFTRARDAESSDEEAYSWGPATDL